VNDDSIYTIHVNEGELEVKKISKTIIKKWVIIVLVVLGLILVVCTYKSIPDEIPIHFNY
jgi:uncharacterized membrane protein